MLERWKKALVESYVGAIALGYLLVSCLSSLMNVVAIPVASWTQRRQFGPVMS